MRGASETVFDGIHALIEMCNCDPKDNGRESEDGCVPDAKAESDFLKDVISEEFSSGADGSDSKMFERLFFGRESGATWLQRKRSSSIGFGGICGVTDGGTPERSSSSGFGGLCGITDGVTTEGSSSSGFGRLGGVTCGGVAPEGRCGSCSGSQTLFDGWRVGIIRQFLVRNVGPAQRTRSDVHIGTMCNARSTPEAWT